MAADEASVFGAGGVSYLQIPAPEPSRLARFYERHFGWRLSGGPAEPSFADGSGHVIGHFVADLPIAGDAGVRPYLSVDDLEQTFASVIADGGEVVTAPSAEGDLRVAVFRDPAGNVVGLWQRAPRSEHNDEAPPGDE